MLSLKDIFHNCSPLAIFGVALTIIVVWVGVTEGIVNLIQWILFKTHVTQTYTPITFRCTKRK